METNNRDHASHLFVHLSIRSTSAERHQAVAVENAALRLQLAAFQRKRKRPVLTTFDRLCWVGLSRVWRGWRGPLLYVKADTVVRWQRERFAGSGPGCPSRNAEGEAGQLPPPRFAA